MRRKDRQRDAAFAWQVMREAPYATLSLADGAGRPYAVPVSQAADEEAGAIYFHCALAGEKYEIFRDGCEAAMSAVSRTNTPWPTPRRWPGGGWRSSRTRKSGCGP